MAEPKKVRIVALRPIWDGTKRVLQGETLEVTEDQAKVLKAEGAAEDAKKGA